MSPQSRAISPWRITLVAGGMLVAVVVLAGCYERVISESGPGARSDVHEPNRTTTGVERVIYGDDE